MNRLQIKLLLLFVVIAIAALTFAGTASAGWTWDDNANGWTWTDDGSGAFSG